jgi:Ca2+:H+ antiporter
LPLALGLPPKEAVLALVTFVIASITLASGRATVMQGAVHLTIFAAFLFLAIIP